MMSKQETLKIFERDTTVTSSKLRRIGYVPATIYGKDIQSMSFQVRAHEFEIAYNHGVRRFTLDGFGKTFNAVVKQVQRNGATGAFLHIEFFVPAGSQSTGKSTPKASASEAEKKPEIEHNQQEEVETMRVEEAVPAH
jgi:ribosomal protein L25 (general stress protein Ctc)